MESLSVLAFFHGAKRAAFAGAFNLIHLAHQISLFGIQVIKGGVLWNRINIAGTQRLGD